MTAKNRKSGICRAPERERCFLHHPNLLFVLTCMISMLVSMMVLSCGGDESDDPLDETPPETEITSGPADGVTLAEPLVTFEWAGNEFVSEYAYRCSPYQEEWSVWSSDMSVVYYLDSGQYIFEVMGRYEEGNEDSTPALRKFSVDIPGPGMLLKPYSQEVLPRKEFTVQVVAYEVADVMLAHLIVKFDPTNLQALEAAPGNIFRAADAPVFRHAIDNSSGVIDINISMINAIPTRINGTEEIVTITFASLSAGSSSVTLDSGSEFRDSENVPLGIESRFGCKIEIAEE